MQLLKTDNKVWCFRQFGSPRGPWLLLPVPHGLVMFSLSPESFWKSTSVFSAVREVDLIHRGLSYTCARAAQEILNQQQTHPSSRVCVIPSSFHVAYASVGTVALPLRSNRVLSPVFSMSVAFSLLSVGKKGKKNIVWTLLNVQIMYKHLISQKAQKLLLFFYFFIFHVWILLSSKN